MGKTETRILSADEAEDLKERAEQHLYEAESLTDRLKWTAIWCWFESGNKTLCPEKSIFSLSDIRTLVEGNKDADTTALSEDAREFSLYLIQNIKSERKDGEPNTSEARIPRGVVYNEALICYILGFARVDEKGTFVEVVATQDLKPLSVLAMLKLGKNLSLSNLCENTYKEWAAYKEMGYDGKPPMWGVVKWLQRNRTLPAKKYPTAIMPRYAGSVIEVAYTDVEAGTVLQSQEAEKALGELDKQCEFFPPPERRLALIISQVQGLKETDHQGQVSQELRILHESYLATTGYDIGINGILVAFDFDYFRDALYPGWRDKRDKQGKRVSFHTKNRDRIRESIDNMRKAYIEVPEFGPIAPVVSRTPVEKLSRGKDKVVLHVIAPSGTRRGGLIIANTMRQLGFLGGQGSARKYAFYHALVQYWDQHGTEKGKITWPTIPKKLRDREGRLIDEKGELILDKKGKPETRWKKGVQAYDAKGDKIYEPNEDKRLACYPVVSRKELIKFFGVNWWNKTKALLDEMEREKVFVMQEADDEVWVQGYRFFPSVEHCIAYNDVRTSGSRAR